MSIEVNERLASNPDFYGEDGCPQPAEADAGNASYMHRLSDSDRALVETLFSRIDDAEQVTRELNESKTIKILMKLLHDDASDSIKEFAAVDLSDKAALLRLQASVYRTECFNNLLLAIEERARTAAITLSDRGL